MNEALLTDLKKCVLCGSCKANCPTYGADTVEPMSARGRLMLLLGLMEGELKPTPLLNDRIFSCLLCGMCESSCPAGVGITEAVYKGRDLLRDSDIARRSLRRIMRNVLKWPQISFRTAGILRPLIPYLHQKGKLPFDIRIPDEPLRDGLKIYKPKKTKGRVALFAGCAVNYIYPHLGESLIGVLLLSGYEVVMPAGEVCCGAPLRALGLEKDAVRFAERNIRAFEKLNAEAVLSLCPTCTLTLKKDYRNLAGVGIENAADISEFMVNRIELPPAEREKAVIYHEPCHLKYGLGLSVEPKELLKKMGYTLIEPKRKGCCGFSISLTHEKLSGEMLDALMEGYGRVETIITSCPGCMAQLGRRHGNVIHLIEAVDRALEPALEEAELIKTS